jgi:pyruvate dehydrogenase (quinone)
MANTVADFMAETLQKAGVKRVYGVVGDSLNGFTDSLRRLDSIDWIHVRHEEAAGFAAAPRRISPASSRSAPAAAGPATCT